MQEISKNPIRSGPDIKSRSIENPNVPLSEATSESWFGLSSGTSAGPRVTHQTAMRIAAFWQGVTMISGDVAKIPLEIYQRGEGTDRSIHADHPAYRLVRRQPNDEQSAFEFFRQMMVHALVWNNAYALIQRDGQGRPTGLLPLLPDRTDCRRLDDGRKVYRSEINHRMEYFDAWDIWHLKGISFNGLEGLDTIRYARHGFGKILARENFASKFFKNGGRVGGILQLPWTKEKSKLDRKEEGFRKTYESGDSAFKTVILRDNAKFHAAQASFSETQMVDVGKEDVKHVARILNMPPHKLGADGKSSYNSLEQENRSYYDNCLAQWLLAIENESWLKLFDRSTRDANQLYFEHTVGALLWADSKTVATIASQGVRSGWLTANEGRKWFNLNSNDAGDQLLIPSGMVPAPTAADDSETDDDPASDSNLRAAIDQMVSETARRFIKRLATHARKAAKQPGTFARWLHSDLESEHISIGRAMFDAVARAQQAIGDAETDHAQQIIVRFRHRLGTAFEIEADLNQTIDQICEQGLEE